MMHRVEDVLVHYVDRKTLLTSKLVHHIDEFGECQLEVVDICKHYHSEILAKNALGDVNDICIILCTFP